MRRIKGESFTIRQVIELTGISEFTLRGWENRYGAFSPKRTETGRRKYSLEDIHKARLLDELVTKGHRIGDIAPCSLAELEALLPSHSEIAPPPSPAHRKQVLALLDLANQFKWDEIRGILVKKRKKISARDYIAELVSPLLAEMGALVGLSQFTVAQEHILSALLKEQLVILRAEARPPRSKARLVMTSPDGDLHDMGLMIAATLSAQEGLHTLFLGPSTPKKDLCETCLRYQATHLLIASTVSEKEGAKESLPGFINFLDRNLPRGITLMLAGRNAPEWDLKINRPLESFKSVENFLEYLKQLS